MIYNIILIALMEVQYCLFYTPTSVARLEVELDVLICFVRFEPYILKIVSSISIKKEK